MKTGKIAVLLMTYGSPATLDDIPAYLKNIYGDKDAKPEVIAEFRRRYSLIGGSPLIRITKEQAAALEKQLQNESQVKGVTFRVVAGMRFSPPFIEDVIQENCADTDEIIGIIMSPQYSPIIMSGYVKTLENGVKNLKRKNLKLKMATDWHLQPNFINALTDKVKKGLNQFPQQVHDTIPVLFSAHSMPKRVIEKEPKYIRDLKETASAVAKESGLVQNQWMFCYQSAGHTPEDWLKPDFADIMPELKAKGHKHVLIAPVQFLADHLEILYDVGIAAREQAETHGITFARTESLNTSPLFIEALGDIVKEQLYMQ